MFSIIPYPYKYNWTRNEAFTTGTDKTRNIYELFMMKLYN